MSYKINFLLPSMSRPEKFFETVENVVEMCLSENYVITAIIEEQDEELYKRDPRFMSPQNARCFFVKTSGKVDAINKGLEYVDKDYDILILIADDIRFTMKGFDSFIEENMRNFFPDLDGCLHYPEPAVNDRQITMPVLGRKLIEEWGYIYNPSYISVWCDTEMLEVLKIMNKVKFVNTLFFSHNHPAWGLAEVDELYRRNESFYQQDSDNYFKRLANNFGL